MNTLVSVIVPTFKRPDRLVRGLRSVLNQTYIDFEVLVIDDDPADNNLHEVLATLKDDRLRLFKNGRTKGANGARNTGILNSKGQFLAFMDDDDEWLPDYLKTQFAILSNTDESYGLVHADYLAEEKGSWLKKHQRFEGNILSELITDQFRIGSGSNIFVKKHVIDTAGLWDEEMKRQQDLEFLVRVLANFKARSNPYIGVKVYGHNDPSPEKTFETREFYVEKIKSHLDSLPKGEQNLFYSNHFRRQTNYLMKMKSYQKAMSYWKKAISCIALVPRKDGKIVLSLIKSL